jgi:hypothetical protein
VKSNMLQVNSNSRSFLPRATSFMKTNQTRPRKSLSSSSREMIAILLCFRQRSQISLRKAKKYKGANFDITKLQLHHPYAPGYAL